MTAFRCGDIRVTVLPNSLVSDMLQSSIIIMSVMKSSEASHFYNSTLTGLFFAFLAEADIVLSVALSS